MKHAIKLYIDTNYNYEELKQVLDKLFEIPSLQYTDCDQFEYKVLRWGIEVVNKQNPTKFHDLDEQYPPDVELKRGR